MFDVYVCDEFEVGNGVLTIWNSKLIGKVEDEKGLERLRGWAPGRIKSGKIICPDLFHNREQFSIISFE